MVDAPGACYTATGLAVGNGLILEAVEPVVGADRTEELLHAPFERQAADRPDAVAVVERGTTLTYGALERRSRVLAAVLRGVGAVRETPVAVLAHPGPELAVAALAVLRAGAVYVPLDPGQPEERLQGLCDDAGVALLVRGSGRLPSLRVATAVAMDDVSLSTGAPDRRSPAIDPEQAAYLIFTSGTTGRPKAVCVPHRAAARHLEAVRGEYGLTPADAVLQFAAPGFDVSIEQLFGALGSGARLVVRGTTAWGAAELDRAVARERLTVVNVPPALFAPWSAAGARPDGSLRLAIVGGEAFPPQAAAAWRRPAALLNAYGPTETVITATLHRVGPADAREGGAVALGVPIGDRRAYVVDPHGNLAPAHAHGHLWLGGGTLARGYVGRPGTTGDHFRPDPWSGRPGARLYRTGDRVARWPDGRLEYLGRADQQLKVRGHRVEPGEVEAVLEAHPGVARAVVDVRRLAGGDAALMAWVLPAGDAVEPGALRDWVRARLPDAMVPERVRAVDRFPTTPSGKVDRAALPDPRPDAAGGSGAPPVTGMEQSVARHLEELLGTSPVGRDADFFRLGGNSIAATRLVARLRDELEAEVPVEDVFDHPVVADLARRLEDRLAQASGRPTLPAPGPRPRAPHAPLSFPQERLWFVQRLAPDSPAYNVPLAVGARGPLSVPLLVRALRGLIERHEILRTSFEVRDGVPRQVISRRADPPWKVVDLTGLPAGERDARCVAVARATLQRPFDLATGPLLRLVLLRTSPGDHVLLLVLHHAIFDGSSTAVLLRELAALYEAHSRGEPVVLPPLSVQYADFALWQRECLDAGLLTPQLEYWSRRLDDLPPVVGLPTDRPRAEIRRMRGAVHRFELPGAAVERSLALGRRERATPFMVHLAAFAALVARLSGERDVGVGSPISGRRFRDLEGLVGCFVNTLVLRTILPAGVTFRELLAGVRGAALGAFRNQDAPFERVVEVLGVARSLAYSPLFQVAFTFEASPGGPPASLGPVRLEALDLPAASAKFDLTLGLMLSGSRVQGSLEYDRDLFDPSTIARMARSLVLLLDGAMAAPDRAVDSLALLSRGERHQVLREWSGGGWVASGGSVVRRVSERASSASDSVAVHGEEGWLSYGELWRRSGAVAGWLVGRGVGPEVRVGVCLERTVEMVVSVLGILRSGGAYVSLEPRQPLERLGYMLSDAGASWVVAEGEVARSLEREGFRVARPAEVAEVAEVGEPGESWSAREWAEGLAYLIYTSGSTGVPKGVGLTRGGLGHLVDWHLERYGLGPGVRMTQLAGLGFDAAVWEIWPALASGASLHLPAEPVRRSPEALREYLAREGIGISFLPTPLAEEVVSLDGGAGAGPSVVLTGGDRLRRHPPAGLGYALVNHYGPTENTVVATAGEAVAGAEGAPSIGRPIGRVEGYLLDRWLAPVAPGVAGELCLGGPGLARGYVGAPGATAERFVPDPWGAAGSRLYRTGDLARHRRDGRIDFLGRRDAQVKVRGFRIELGEVEAALASHPGVKASVCSVKGEGPGARLVAYAVPREPDLDLDDVRRHLSEHLPESMVPSALIALEELPLLASGKVDRRALPEPTGDDLRGGAAYVAPRTPLEMTVAQVWSRVLGVQPVGLHDNFFQLGGHSLLAVRLLDEIRSRLDVELALADLFRVPTVEAMAARAEVLREGARPAAGGGAGAPETPTRSPLVSLRSDGQGVPFYCVHPVGGHALAYVPLARALAPRRPVLAFQCPGLEAGEPALDGVEALAERYLEAMVARRRRGPYHLGGWSFGGLVAFEMARRLRETGDDVSLVLVDCATPGSKDPIPLDELSLTRRFVADFFARSGVDVSEEDRRRLAGHDLDALLDAALERAVAVGLLASTGGRDSLRRFQSLFVRNVRSERHYRPGSLAGEALLVRASTPGSPSVDPSLGWSGLVERLTVETVSADHYSLLRPPAVRSVADHVARWLERTRPSPPARAKG